VLTAGFCSAVSVAQTLKQRPPAATHQQNEDIAASQKVSESVGAEPMAIPMSVGVGTPIKVAIESDARVRKVGQPIQCRTTEPVYAFDKLLIPVGTVVNGKVSAIDSVPKMVRTMQAANGNFSPARKVHVQFDELVMGDGRRLPLQTVASPAPDGVLRFVSAKEKPEQKDKAQDAASKQVSATRQAIHQKWNDLQHQIHEPGKMHKLKRIVLAQLPVHPQYIDAGTSFNADLLQPLDFGTGAVKPARLTDVRAAVLETDWTRIYELIVVAELEIHRRQHLLAQDQGETSTERYALANATNSLRGLQRDLALWQESAARVAVVTRFYERASPRGRATESPNL
jgi:hypothetical protein